MLGVAYSPRQQSRLRHANARHRFGWPRNRTKYGYDDAFRITGITDTVTPANSYTYGFDSLDRLTSAVKTGTTRSWTYDANGNRLTETGASASTYTIASTNNRISSITGALPRTYAYDAAGNVLTYASITATYNNRGRMKTLANGAVTATYLYNALGQLTKQSGGPSGTVHYVYDEAGHLLGEYTSTGALIQETVWMGDTPVATIRPGTPALIYYVHTDHLNTPRRVTRPSDNKLMWTWYSDAFGADLPNQNPAGGGTFKYNLRFPGQLYDSHAGLIQNYFRDYDPAIGRYVESDPIGLDGGINTYAYGASSPVLNSDAKGLDYWLEGPVAGEGGFGLHKSICVGRYPNNAYCISFGVDDSCKNAFSCTGEVYEDTTAPGKPDEWTYRRTSEESDNRMAQQLRKLVGTQGAYHVIGNSCRDFSWRVYWVLQFIDNGVKGTPRPSSHGPLRR
jgi:RHS repeat-associated protein